MGIRESSFNMTRGDEDIDSKLEFFFFRFTAE